MLREIAKDLWVAEQALRFGGLDIGTRMSVVRLGSGDLLLHSPIRLTDELARDLDERGRLRYLVAPNCLHHLFAGEYSERYPQSEAYVAPGLEKKRSDLRIAGVLPDAAPGAWGSELDWIFFDGLPLANEVVFLHRPSRTLITCDLAFNVGPEAPLLTRLGFSLLGRYKKFGPTVLERLLIRNRPAARASLEAILRWDFDRVILAHGAVLERGGPEGLRRGYAWLLGG